MSLGIVLAPYGRVGGGYPPSGITYTRSGNGQYLCPDDPQFNTKFERGYYFDTSLGAPRLGFFQRMKAKRAARKLGLADIPTDFDLATVRGYLPVSAGWVQTEQGYQTGPWLPPHGEWPNNPNRVVTPLGGLRDGTPATTEDVVALMNAHNDRLFTLAIVSTSAVAVSALLTVFRTLKLVKEGR